MIDIIGKTGTLVITVVITLVLTFIAVKALGTFVKSGWVPAIIFVIGGIVFAYVLKQSPSAPDRVEKLVTEVNQGGNVFDDNAPASAAPAAGG